MDKKYDFIIVGSGLFGSILSRELTNSGFTCLIIDKRSHIGGNCYTKNIEGIDVHLYGPHIFHTSIRRVYDYVLNYTEIHNFSCTPKLLHGDRVFSLPINLMTLNQLWGITTPEEAKKKLKDETLEYRLLYGEGKNAEEWALCNVGKTIYEIFYKDYLIKQWGRNPIDINPDIIKRQVVRTSYNDNYYHGDPYQGILDYNMLFNNLTEGIDVLLNTNYLDDRERFNSMCKIKTIYSGPIDEFYDYKYGTLEYRSLEFRNEILNIEDYQGVFMVSYPELKYDFTRIIEHKHFRFKNLANTVITKEYPKEWKKGMEGFYPVNNDINKIIYDKYLKESLSNDNVVFGGRLGSYQYLNMDQTINMALLLSEEIINNYQKK